ncbi:MAG: hypothetical protein HRU19_22330 [Pseudobacteriovorax sp.]|nr:hypothetical protein [Pseudobacteriovorax sp.]
MIFKKTLLSRFVCCLLLLQAGLKAHAAGDHQASLNGEISFDFVKDGVQPNDILIFESSPTGDSLDYIYDQFSGITPTPVQVFWAISQPGDTIPNIFKGGRLYSPRPRGWARKPIIKLNGGTTINKKGACNDTSFQEQIAGGAIDDGRKFRRLNITPQNRPKEFFPSTIDNSGHWKSLRYRYAATITQATQWRGKICARSVQNADNNHNYRRPSSNPNPGGSIGLPPRYIGPTVGFQIYDKSINGWRYVKNSSGNSVSFEIPANTTKNYSWVRNGSAAHMRIYIENAMPLDEFDIITQGKQVSPGGRPARKQLLKRYVNDLKRLLGVRDVQAYNFTVRKQGNLTRVKAQVLKGVFGFYPIFLGGQGCQITYDSRVGNGKVPVGGVACDQPTAFSVGGF